MPDKPSTNVVVAVRCRPLSSTEKANANKTTVAINTKAGIVSVSNPSQPGQAAKSYTFDLCFDWGAKQLDIYNKTARGVVANCLEGYNGTIFAYGQTGTGKTFTMEGIKGDPELQGIIPNSFAHIFGEIQKAEGGTKFLVRCSYLEIYCEMIRDLLAKDQSKKLDVKETPDRGVYVKDLATFSAKNSDDMMKIMTKGNENRKVASTAMNATSSRSHAIFTITIERSDPPVAGSKPNEKDAIRMGKLNLVDLAGSERQNKTGASGQVLKEAQKINLSLSSLGNVISALVDGKSKHIPYRDSKLTRLLQDSLGGNANTVMIANFGPADYNYDETMTTLRYADRAKKIKNKPKINENPKDALLREMQEQIEKLRAQLGDDYDTGESGESEEDETAEGWTEGGGKANKKGRKGKKGMKSRKLSDGSLQKIQDTIEAERQAMLADTKMKEEEKEEKDKELQERQEILRKAKEERLELERKKQAIEAKIMQGGVNLIEKDEEQQKLLEESRQEMERQQAAEQELRTELAAKEEEQLDLEEKYKTLDEGIEQKTKKMKKIYAHIMSANVEIEQLKQERAQQTEAMLDNIRELTKELNLSMLIIDNYIPPEFQDEIEQRSAWNEEIGEWQIVGIPYTGNSMQGANESRVAMMEELERPELPYKLELEKQYFVYGSMMDEARAPKAPKSSSSRSSKGARDGKRESSRSKGDKSAKDKKERWRKKGGSSSSATEETSAYPESRPSTARPRTRHA